MSVRRGTRVPGRVERSVLGAIGVTIAALLPLAPASASAASSKQVSASTLIKDACVATLGAPAFRVQGHITDGNSAMFVDVYFGSAGSLVTVTQHKNRTINLIVNGPSLYMKANLAFWQSETNNSAAAASGANHWFDVSSDKKDFGGLAKSLDRQAIVPDCARGSSRYVGTATVHGLKAIKIHLSSGKESDTYYVKSGSTPYLLRVTGSSSQSQSGDISFNDYGVQPDTAAPPGAIPFSNSGSTGATGSTG
jgi:hypothetical protein